MAFVEWSHVNQVPDWLTVGASLLIVFPIVLLSTLEASSPFNPFSTMVWWSFGAACGAWLAFYLESTLLAGAAGWLAWKAIGIGGYGALNAATLLLVPA